MFFDNPDQTPTIAARTSCTIFVLPTPINDSQIIQLFPAKRTRTLTPPPDKLNISIDQMRDFTAITGSKQTDDQFLIIAPADTLNVAAQNAFLKNLEEPRPHYHYVLLTSRPSQLLPTILSRAQLYILRNVDPLTQPPQVADDIKSIAKQLISAQPQQLPALATNIAKHKDARPYALQITATAIELLYKSYFATSNPQFLTKLPNFLTLYDNLSSNGHIKLHLVADLC